MKLPIASARWPSRIGIALLVGAAFWCGREALAQSNTESASTIGRRSQVIITPATAEPEVGRRTMVITPHDPVNPAGDDSDETVGRRATTDPKPPEE